VTENVIRVKLNSFELLNWPTYCDAFYTRNTLNEITSVRLHVSFERISTRFDTWGPI